jgi:hypothetical protein
VVVTDEELRALWDDLSLSSSEVVRRTGAPRWWVYQRAKRLGLAQRRAATGAQRDGLFAERWRDVTGWTRTDLAKEYDRSELTLYKWAKRLGLSPRKQPRHPQEKVTQLIEMYEGGVSAADIRRETGIVNYTSVAKYWGADPNKRRAAVKERRSM